VNKICRARALPEGFYDRGTLIVARELLGTKLVRDVGSARISGMIVETEAYVGRQDTASHASKGKTPRNEVMFGPPGRAYVYFVYGMHYMLNVVTENAGRPGAVLIRAVEPLDGVDIMRARRKADGPNLTNGPAKLCQAFDIDKRWNGLNLTSGKTMWLEEYRSFCEERIQRGPRIGIDYADAKHREAHWRFWLGGNPHVSK
jgi:DNA-3-methyladenine glycosylase